VKVAIGAKGAKCARESFTPPKRIYYLVSVSLTLGSFRSALSLEYPVLHCDENHVLYVLRIAFVVLMKTLIQGVIQV
jgi:hypothetical protein